MSDETSKDMFQRLHDEATKPPCPCCGGKLQGGFGDDPLFLYTRHYANCGKCGKIPVVQNDWGRYVPVDAERIKPPLKTIESSLDCMSGMPCLKGTRMPVATILAELADPDNQRTAAQVAEEYGQDPVAVLDALREIAVMFQKPFWR